MTMHWVVAVEDLEVSVVPIGLPCDLGDTCVT